MSTELLSPFFAELGPRLDMAREVDERLNAELAYRFNVLDYLRTSELGLSRVIADLLNPCATHGQKTLFLDTLLRDLQHSSTEQRRPLDLTRDYGKWSVAAESVDVRVERTIPGGRRLDISVEFEDDGGRRRCLAIENKPYAGDQKDQIQAYLNFLEKEYGADHLLIYLSSTGNLPSERSVKRGRLKKHDVVVMGFWVEGGADSSEDDDGSSGLRLPLKYSLADWFDACRQRCEVERLRTFLRDAKTFCGQHFGGVAMFDTNELETAIAFIRRDRKHAQVAQLVAQAVPELQNRVQLDVLKHVTEALGEFRNEDSKWRLEPHGSGRKRRLRLYKKNHWSQTAFSGVWFMLDRDTFGVGIEWPQEGTVNLVERVHECFGDVNVGRQETGGGDNGRPDTWWFRGSPKAEDWRRERLLGRSDDQLRDYVDTVVALMKALTCVIDDAEEAIS